MKIFTLLFILSFFLYGAQLTKSADYVIDDTNKLMWQDSMQNVTTRLIHEKAIQYCNNLNASGFHDWRLPTVKEYRFIIDKTRIKEEIMINKAFKYVLQDDYWIADRTWMRNFGRYGYYIFIKSGAIYYQNRSYQKFARCVREMK